MDAGQAGGERVVAPGFQEGLIHRAGAGDDLGESRAKEVALHKGVMEGVAILEHAVHKEDGCRAGEMSFTQGPAREGGLGFLHDDDAGRMEAEKLRVGRGEEGGGLATRSEGIGDTGKVVGGGRILHDHDGGVGHG